MELPVRRALPHTPPVSVSQYARGAYYFLTLCIDREAYRIAPSEVGRKGPLIGNLAVRILCALSFYQAREQFHPIIAVVMPDHLHLIAQFPEDRPHEKFVRTLKAYVTREFGIQWQSGYFDHRLRSEAECLAKTEYVRQNPVRKELCDSPEEWPYLMTWRR